MEDLDEVQIKLPPKRKSITKCQNNKHRSQLSYFTALDYREEGWQPQRNALEKNKVYRAEIL